MAKKTEIQKLRDKADKLLTPIIKNKYPKCIVCNADTQVAHHFIEKSRSSNLRYDLDNLIPLCHVCHTKIHNRFGSSITGSYDIVDVIVQKRGREWYDRLQKDSHKIIKVNKAWYEENYNRLKQYEEGKNKL